MEWLALIFVIFALGILNLLIAKLSSIIKNFFKKNKIQEDKFKIRILKELISFDDDLLEADCLKLEFQGLIRAHSDNQTLNFNVRLYDITEGDEKPIMCHINEFQDMDSMIFSYQREKMIPYQYTMISEWMPLFQVPMEFLGFPKRGSRQIRAEFDIRSKDKILETASYETSFNIEEKGYLDTLEERDLFEEMVIKIALFVSNSDDVIVKSEMNIIKQWVANRIFAYQKSSRDKHKERIINYIRHGNKQVKDGRLDIKEMINTINDIANSGEKYELYELCLKVAGADEKAEQQELSVLKNIANLLNLDKGKIQLMHEKILPINIYTNKVDNEKALIGIMPEMTHKQIKKHLVQEYSKWNTRAAHKDEKIRKQAEEMIKIIISLKEEYK